MYLLNVKAIGSQEQYVAYREAHNSWVKEGFDKGWFLFAGPKNGELGGFILVNNIDRSQLDIFIQQDPFVIEKVAEYKVNSFSIALAVKELASLKM